MVTLMSKDGYAARIKVEIEIDGKKYVDAFHISNAMLTDAAPSVVGNIIQSRMYQSGKDVIKVLYNGRDVRNS